jgi:hypothetical protein
MKKHFPVVSQGKQPTMVLYRAHPRRWGEGWGGGGVCFMGFGLGYYFSSYKFWDMTIADI